MRTAWVVAPLVIVGGDPPAVSDAAGPGGWLGAISIPRLRPATAAVTA